MVVEVVEVVEVIEGSLGKSDEVIATIRHLE